MKTRQNIVATITLLIACGGANQTPAANTTTEAPVTPESADKAIVDQLATARCEQEQGCKNIGPGAKFDSAQVCMDQVRGKIGNDLNAYKCPRGLDHDAIDRCMMAIKSEECSHPFDTLTRYDKCRTGAICMK